MTPEEKRERRDYFRNYMREYRKRERERLGLEINPKLGRPPMKAKVHRPAPEIHAAPGWPTKQQLMAGR
jgi:hypothetical protein